MHGVFTMAHPPPETHWGTEAKKHPKGTEFMEGKAYRPPRKPTNGKPGRYQYIRMELCNEGDAEELIKRQEEEALQFDIARGLIFQITFALFAAAEKFSVKHYDVKLLNIFVHREMDVNKELVLRYGLGSHTFAVQMPADQAYIAKLADFGTACIDPSVDGRPVTVSHFTTLENTPADFLILGDDAEQGHEHDSWGLGLCMLHCFTGHRPYEEIMEKIKCPPNFRRRLKKIWESDDGYSALRTVISDDDNGTMYDTLYRLLVLFGIPGKRFKQESSPLVWEAISYCLESDASILARTGRPAPSRPKTDVNKYNSDYRKFSINSGDNHYIRRARDLLGNNGLALLLDLCCFDPENRKTPEEALESPFFEDMIEGPETVYAEDATVRTYSSFATQSQR